MIQNIQNFRPLIQLKRMILFLGIFTVVFLPPNFLFAQIEPGDFEFDGENRTYDVYLPDNYTGTIDFPLLICLHPYGWNGQQGMEYTNFNQVADTSDFLVVYPNAIPNWNSGIGDNPSWPAPNVNDVGFIDALIDTINFHYSINLEKVYVCGFSNGGFMAYKLACELSHRFAAIASVSGVISMTTASNCEPSNTMPVLQIHGTADAVVPINGGATGWYSVDETLNIWIDFNNCLEVDTILLPDIDPTDGCTVEKISYTSCTDNSNVVNYKVINGGHTWPGASPLGPPFGNTNQDINASVEIWNFFKDYPPGPCLPEGITFSTQDEIDNFQTNYPTCTEIEGDVTINGDNITNLNGLNILNYIGGNLLIGDSANPFNGNQNLTSFEGLGNLTTIEGGLNISGNDILTTLIGLENVTYIGGDIIIASNNTLSGLIGLSSINTIWGNLDIFGNNAITNLEGLNNLISIMGRLRIYWNPSLLSLSDLENLVIVGEDISIANPSLSSLAGLENLTSVEGSLSIGFCGIFGCEGNPSLITLSGLENIASIEGDLRIIDNNSLNTLTGLSSLTSVEGNMSIGNIGAAGSFGNASLSNFDGLQYLTSIGGNLNVEGNESLMSLSGVDSLAYIGGHLTIGANEVLSNISNLNGVVSVGGSLYISNNDSLSSLSGLENIDAATIENITIHYNDSLSDCDAQSICDYLGSPNGTIVISNNAPGCDSQQEVQDDCDSVTFVSEIISEETFTISPNPLESISVIKYTITYKSPVTIKIFDLTGQEIVRLIDDIQQQGKQQIIFNSSNLPSGIYFCVLKTNNGMQTRKIIKL